MTHKVGKTCRDTAWPSLLTRRVFLLAALTRVLLLCTATHLPVLNDVDYDVFTDAARLMVEGGSPYQRATYRYPPLYAAALVPGVLLGVPNMWGRAVFCAADLAVGALTTATLRSRGVDAHTARAHAAAFLLSPLAIITSTRGSADAIACALVVGLLLAMEALHGVTRAAVAGVALGLAVHVRIYPIIYALPCFLALGEGASQHPARGSLWARLAHFMSAQRILFAVIAAATFAACTAAAAFVYGFDSLAEGLLYHAGRVDVRHNFSMHWASAYFSALAARPPSEWWLSAARAAPSLAQLGAVAAIGVLARSDLPLALFLQTLAFVTLNRVITAQYFNWWLALLPLILHRSRLSLRTGVCLGVGWLCAELHWVSWAHALEGKGEAVHAQLFAATLLFAAANVTLGVVIALHHDWPRHGVARDDLKRE